MKSGSRETYGSSEPDIPAGLIPEVLMIGWDRFPTATAARLGPHIHPNAYEVCYLADGSVDWWVRDEPYRLRRGDVFFTRPGEPHGGSYSVMQPCELYWIQIVSGCLPTDLQSAMQGMQRRIFVGSPCIPQHFDTLLAEHREGGLLCGIAARSALFSLVVAVLRDEARAAPTGVSEHSAPVGTALQLLEQDLLGEMSVGQIAHKVGLSTPRFVERFLQETGETPGEWRMRRRLDAAKSALREPDVTVTEIAFRFGFASSQYFATAFKRYVGMSPGEWRSLRL